MYMYAVTSMLYLWRTVLHTQLLASKSRTVTAIVHSRATPAPVLENAREVQNGCLVRLIGAASARVQPTFTGCTPPTAPPTSILTRQLVRQLGQLVPVRAVGNTRINYKQ